MNAPKKAGRSLGGGVLDGQNLVRLVYLDESGISSREPWLAVCGVVINADKQLAGVEDHLDDLVRKHIPEKHRDGFVFHATDIFNGGKKGKSIFFDKEEWPEERRYKILDDLVAVPAKFNLPVCFAFLERAKFIQGPMAKEVPDKLTVAAHAATLSACTMSIEKWMRNNTSDEVCMLIAENNNEVKLAAKAAHALFRDPKALTDNGILESSPIAPLPFTKIRDAIHFTEKAESRHLQVADICSWTLRKALSDRKRAARFFRVLWPQLASFSQMTLAE